MDKGTAKDIESVKVYALSLDNLKIKEFQGEVVHRMVHDK
jgi:hypothetical protein